MFRILILSLLVLSCATGEVSLSNADKIKTDMGSFNQRILGTLYRNEMKKDLSRLDEEIYLHVARNRHDPSEKDYIEFLDTKDIEVAVSGQKTTFTVCVKSIASNLILCDVADTAFVDFVSRDMSQRIESLVDQIQPLK